MITKKKKQKIVVIGGGTGSFVVLAGLRNYPIDLTAIVTVADSGGSTGRLRTEFGFLPIGDFRQCLAALASEDNNDYIRQLLLYRFSKGKGLSGHNLGNLILTALTDLTSSEPKALEIAARIFRLHGRILPITTTDIQLVATYKDGQVIIGEHNIDEPRHLGGKQIIDLTTKPEAQLYSEAEKVLKEANLIIIGPGDLYTSILPNLIIKNVKKTFASLKGKIIYVVNLMTRFSQTHNFTANDHINEIEKYLGRKVDIVLINNRAVPKKILLLYEKEREFPVKDDIAKNSHFQTIRKDYLALKPINKVKSDILKRSYLRHDSYKLGKTIISLLD